MEPSSHDVRIRALAIDHADFVWRSLRRLGVPELHVDDAVQEVFVTVARKLDSIEPGKERSFLFGVASNVAAHARRSFARRREVAAVDGFDVADETMPGADVELVRAEERRALDRVLDTLDDDLRVVFVLFELEEMSTAAIAECVGVPHGTVASRLRRARESFQAAVTRERAAARRASHDAGGARTGGTAR
ncbi:MAG: sigma-70 family RNA polymerase sigma factor [Polyangiaceae bacterium]